MHDDTVIARALMLWQAPPHDGPGGLWQAGNMSIMDNLTPAQQESCGCWPRGCGTATSPAPCASSTIPFANTRGGWTQDGHRDYNAVGNQSIH